VLLVSAVLIAPWRSLIYVGVVTALTGLCGVVYILWVMHRARWLTVYTGISRTGRGTRSSPLWGYGAISAGAITLAASPVGALFIIAGGIVLLVFIGIRNAWDTVTYIAIKRL